MFYSGRISNHIFEVSIGIGTAVLISFVTYRVLRDPKKKISRIIDTMECLNKGTVHIKNRDYVEEVVSQLIKGGASKLQVIADFDHTITRVHLNGAKCPSTYCVLDESPNVPDSYKLESKRLLDYYHPLENDPHLTKEQKTPLMIEWYTKSMQLLPHAGVKREDLPGMVGNCKICFRDGVPYVFSTLQQHNVPLLVFSAGIGDVLREALVQKNILYSNVEIIANFFKFDEKDQLAGYKSDLIHTFNKNQASLDNREYFEKQKNRNNVILLGDSLGDIDMMEGIADVNASLKIGFLNHNIEKNLSRYLDNYDIVLTDDQTMEVFIGLLQSIL